ncbi:hypothetical protein IJI99_01685, partial [bacterium]|nr:hypothetical protein [bacterium]
MMTSTFSCPHGRIIGGKHVKCFDCPTGSTYDSTSVSCQCDNPDFIWDWNTVSCQANCQSGWTYDSTVGACLPDDYVHNNCTNPVALMDRWSGCNSLAALETACLLDPRDYQTYRVRKFADGSCWMIDNLAYGGDYGVTDGCVANNGWGNFSGGGA